MCFSLSRDYCKGGQTAALFGNLFAPVISVLPTELCIAQVTPRCTIHVPRSGASNFPALSLWTVAASPRPVRMYLATTRAYTTRCIPADVPLTPCQPRHFHSTSSFCSTFPCSPHLYHVQHTAPYFSFTAPRLATDPCATPLYKRPRTHNITEITRPSDCSIAHVSACPWAWIVTLVSNERYYSNKRSPLGHLTFALSAFFEQPFIYCAPASRVKLCLRQDRIFPFRPIVGHWIAEPLGVERSLLISLAATPCRL